MPGPYISDEGEGVSTQELLSALLHAKAVFQLRAISTALGLHPLQNIACENPDTLRGTFSGGEELSFHDANNSLGEA